MEKEFDMLRLYVESPADYQYPDPIRSYKIKIRVISKVKGQSVGYNESIEEVGL